MNPIKRKGAFVLALAGASLGMTSCGGGRSAPVDVNLRPVYLGMVTSTSYDGDSDDLLTAGLGAAGLAAATAPGYVDPNNPTAAELRRNAIYNNYRAVLDINANSGYGTLYGPNVDAAGNVTNGAGKIAGTEYLAYSDDGSGTRNVTLMVQVPDSFDPAEACIVTGTSSGSRGIYGAIGSSGEWGLKHHCAVAYTDKGSGTGLYTFDDDGVNLQNGVRASRAVAGKNAIFAAALSDAARAQFALSSANRVAFKHAHSQQNPEQDWGKFTLQAVEFAFYVLNEKYGTLAGDGKTRTVLLTPKNTITVASSISNGGGSALLAAEQDTGGLISGVAASEPQVQPTAGNYTVRQGGATVGAAGRALFDKGLLTGANLAAQQNDAYARLHAYGWLPDSDVLQVAHAGTNILVAVSYAYAYGKFSVTDKLCGFSFAQTDANGLPVAFTATPKATSFAAQNGIVGNVIYENAIGGAVGYPFGASPSSGLVDQSLDGFLCLRALATGVDPVTGGALNETLAAQSARVLAGVAAVKASGNLHGKPAIIVQGRSDTLIPVNNASRAYLALNASVEGSNSKLRYIEVSNANHFDSFSNALPASIVPLHVYLIRALDAMYAYLKTAQALPPSQVVRTVTRAGNATPITLLNVPPIAAAPPAGNSISVSGAVVDVPN